MISRMAARWLPEPQYAPCDECGASVARTERAEHECDRERWLDFQMFQLRDEVAELEDQLDAYLDSAAGRFELFYAARTRGAT